jgi:hypothetical protein
MVKCLLRNSTGAAGDPNRKQLAVSVSHIIFPHICATDTDLADMPWVLDHVKVMQYTIYTDSVWHNNM